MTRTSISRYVLQDRRVNKGYPKSQVVLALYRWTALSKMIFDGPWGFVPRTFFAIQYKIVSEWLLGVEIPATTKIGPRFKLRHGVGTVINPSVIIGSNVLVRQNVTIGNKNSDDDCPRVCDDVAIGAGAVIIGRITIGARAKIGPLAYVDFDVPAGGVVVTQRGMIR